MNLATRHWVGYWLLCLGVSPIGCATSVPAAAADAPPAADSDQSDKAEQQNPHLLRTRTQSVAVFKNGLGFFLRSGTALKRDGWLLADRIPPAHFGTLAVFSFDEDESVDVVGAGPGEVVEFDGQDAPDTLQARRDRLAAAVRLKLALDYRENGSDRQAQGELVSVSPRFAILDTGQASIAVPLETIKRMQYLDMPLRIHVASDGEPDPASRIGIAYLSSGITWIPEYSIEILDDETARLTLRGTLVNEAEDLIHCDVNFVVGVPHFAHADRLAPIAVGQAIRTIGAAVAPPQLRSQIMNRAGLAYDVRPQAEGAAAVPEFRGVEAPGDVRGFNLAQDSGAAASDYTVYTKKDLTVRRGEKAIVKLFSKTIRYTHIYRWEMPGDLRHYLQVHNDDGTAWTTGPYLAMSKGQPLSEDLLQYTAVGSCAEIPVTTAINISTGHREMETDRRLKAHSPSHNVFLDLVTLRGEIKLRNREQREVEIVVSVPVPGKPTEASDGGVPRADSSQLQLLQRRGSVEWTLHLKPGEAKTLTYEYERYVPAS